MLHHVQPVNQLPSPKVFSTTYQTPLTYVVNLSSSTVFLDLDVFRLLHDTASILDHGHRISVAIFPLYPTPYTLMPTIRYPDPALSTGFAIISLRDQAVKLSSCPSVAQE
jgi:hypothetical protein